MAISRALEISARAFSTKYACKFDFSIFDSRVEEFTFLRPNGGWIDVYKVSFGQSFKKALEAAALGVINNFNGEAMLDDFEYSIIKPYVNESERGIKHKSYVGMDRVARLEYLEKLTAQTPSNLVDLYTEKYKNGELSTKAMRSALSYRAGECANYTELASFIKAIENVNSGRSFVWRAFRPFKSSAEKREASFMKNLLIKNAPNGEELYEECVADAYKTFDGYQKVKASLAESMKDAKEELNRLSRMNEALRESNGTDGRRHAPLVNRFKAPAREEQI